MSAFVWIYLLGLILPFIPALLLPLPLLPRAAVAYGALIGSATMVFSLFPTDGRYLRSACGDPDWPLDLVYRLDPATNLFPSLHVGLATLVVLCLRHVQSRWTAPVVILACVQPVAVLLVKQHTLADVLAGSFLAFAVYQGIFASRTGISIQP
jgi:hypothetical protein